MTMELHVITAREFIKMGAHGKPDWNGSRQVLNKLARACLESGIDRALIDLRDMSATTLTRQQLTALVHVFKQVGFDERHRVAVLHAPRPTAKAPLFAALAKGRGLHVAAFIDFEESVDWLSREEEAEMPSKEAPGGAPKQT